MRAILINPFDRTVSEFDLGEGLAAQYAALSGPGFPVGDEDGNFPTDPAQWEGLEREPRQVHLIDICDLGGGQDLIVDDEGRLSPYQACFSFAGSDAIFAGRALIVGCEDGETIATALPLALAVARVVWLPWYTNYDPPAPTFISFSDDVVRKFL